MTDADLERALAEKLEPEPATDPRNPLHSLGGLWVRTLEIPSQWKPAWLTTDGNSMLALIEAMRENGFGFNGDNTRKNRAHYVRFFRLQMALDLDAEVVMGQSLPRTVALAAAKALGIKEALNDDHS